MARLTPTDRKDQILSAALDAAEATNYMTITREEIAERAGCSPALVSAYLGAMDGGVRDEVMRAAVAKRRARVVAQGLLAQDAIAQGAPDFLKAKAAAAVV
ncbi:MAG: hypothetical protein RSG92_15300 [Pseudomonas sp.]